MRQEFARVLLSQGRCAFVQIVDEEGYRLHRFLLSCGVRTFVRFTIVNVLISLSIETMYPEIPLTAIRGGSAAEQYSHHRP